MLLLSALLCVAVVPAYAQISVNINIAPPAVQYELAPQVAPGHIWVPGYWGWHGDRYIWVRGRSIVQRVGYDWEPERWEQRDGRYYRHGGKWTRDPGYHAVKVKKEKKPKHRDEDKNNRGHSGKQGKGNKHDR